MRRSHNKSGLYRAIRHPAASLPSPAAIAIAFKTYAPLLFVAASFAPLLALGVTTSLTSFGKWFALLPAVVLPFVIWKSWPTPTNQIRQGRLLAILLLAAGYLTAIAGLALLSPQVTCVATLLIVASIGFDVLGRSAWRFTPAWLALWLLVPPPFQAWTTRLAAWLQDVAATWATATLDFLRIDHFCSAATIALPGHEFSLSDTSIILESLAGLIAFALLLVTLTPRRWIGALLLVSTTVFWAILAEVLRVLSAASIWTYAELDVTKPPWEVLTNWLAFLAVICMLLCTDRILLFFFEPASRKAPKRSRHTATDTAKAPPRLYASWLTAALFVATIGLPTAAFLATQAEAPALRYIKQDTPPAP